MGVGIGGIRSHHVIRDAYSGARVAYPLSKRTADAHARNFRHFLGLRGSELTTRTFIKMDEAGELEQAAHAVGMVPETSLPNRSDGPTMPSSKEMLERKRNVVALFTLFTSNLVFPMSTTHIAIHMLAFQCHSTSLQ